MMNIGLAHFFNSGYILECFAYISFCVYRKVMLVVKSTFSAPKTVNHITNGCPGLVETEAMLLLLLGPKYIERNKN